MIGYGNTLRCDDGAGYRIAEQVESWADPSIHSLAVHQLTPDLAEAIATAQQVIFVDATAAATPPVPIQVESITADFQASFTGHISSARSLLALTQLLYHRVPIAYQLLIPATDFSLGETFSPLTQTHVAIALKTLQRLIQPPTDEDR